MPAITHGIFGAAVFSFLASWDEVVLVAKALEAHPKIARVHYPGLASHPQHSLAMRQQKTGGGIVSFEAPIAAHQLMRAHGAGSELGLELEQVRSVHQPRHEDRYFVRSIQPA